jgi:hypothetical protein
MTQLQNNFTMKNLTDKKTELEETINNSIWENFQIGLTYKFQNGKDLWVNGHGHFNYQIDIADERLVLKMFPNGADFIVELKYGDILYLQDNKQQFEMRFKSRL